MNEYRVRLIRFRIRHYRNCLDTVFTPNSELSTLIGVNGAGKTTLLHGIQLLHKLAHFKQRYRAETATHRCSIEASFELCAEKEKPTFIHYKAKIGYSLDDKNQDEISFAAQLWKFEIRGKSPTEWLEMPHIFNGYDEDRIKWEHSISNRNMEMVHYNRRAVIRKRWSDDFVKEYEVLIPYVAIILKLLSNIRYYGATQFTNPELCPASIEIEDERVRARGFLIAGHQRFIHDLYLAWKKKDKSYKQFESLVGKDTLGLVTKISFKEFDFPANQYEVKSGGRILKREGHRQLVIPFFHHGNLKLSPNQLSEGTLKTIALTFYLTTDQSRILLVEEPEVGIHHGLLKSIVGIIKDFSRDKQIILTTHSDFILDSLVPDDVFLVESQKSKGIKVRRLPEKLSKRNFHALRDFLTNTGGLGEYIRAGGVADAI